LKKFLAASYLEANQEYVPKVNELKALITDTV
jgi:hypothetical protein